MLHIKDQLLAIAMIPTVYSHERGLWCIWQKHNKRPTCVFLPRIDWRYPFVYTNPTAKAICLILFVEGKVFPVKLRVAERGKYIRDVITNTALRIYIVINTVWMLCYKVSDERNVIVVSSVRANVLKRSSSTK